MIGNGVRLAQFYFQCNENKRSGAYAFVWFLQQAKILNITKITPPAITLLIAESSPKDKMIGLICTFLGKNKKKIN